MNQSTIWYENIEYLSYSYERYRAEQASTIRQPISSSNHGLDMCKVLPIQQGYLELGNQSKLLPSLQKSFQSGTF